MKKIRSIFYVNILFLFCISAQSQEATFTIQNQQWIHDFVQLNFKQNFTVGVDAGLRWRNTLESVSQSAARISMFYKFSNGLKLGGGFLYGGYYNLGYYSSTEFRPYQEIGLDKKKEKHTIQFRYRIEERFFTDYSKTLPLSHRIVFRNRFNFMFNFKLASLGNRPESPELWFTASDELFLNLPTADSDSWFDQNRIIVGPVLKFSNSLSIQLTYNFQLGSTSVSHAYRITNVIWFSMRHSFDFKTK